MNHKENFNGKHFDVGTGENISLNEIKNIVLSYYPDVEFDYIEERVGDILLTKANIEPLGELDWEPKIDIKKGIHTCFRGELK